MQSQLPSASASAQYQHTQPLLAPLPVSDDRSSPSPALQNVSRDTSTSPLSIPDTTRSPSSVNTSTPQSPLTPSNSSPRSFRSFSSQQHNSDSHSPLSASPLSASSPGGSTSSHSRLLSGLVNAAPARIRFDDAVDASATPVVASSFSPFNHDTSFAHAHNTPNLSRPAPLSLSLSSSTEKPDHPDVLGTPITSHGLANGQATSNARPSAFPGDTTSIAHTPNSTATSAALAPTSPLRSLIPSDGFAAPKAPALSPPNRIPSAGQPALSFVSASPTSNATLKTSQTSPSLTVDQSQLQSPSAASYTTQPRGPTLAPPDAPLGSPGSQRTFTPSQQSCGATSDSLTSPVAGTPGTADFRTPNVYINGLPPNFPEEELFKMTREFGNVISVRTFTRHVCDKPSGYGFVLFELIDAAEKCIESLRKYRNLHPSFSKQIHKIPGTVYSSPTFQAAAGAQCLPADSFKARMEQLKDNASTNLYMEGLPLSIDEMMLGALVKPYKICSSRFFQTRLSNPPRMIAFVRFESRTAAEEIIERLHGRIIRGMEDSGARISVRFADTTEQRELRRMERTSHDGEHSPGRLSMAQAALLNLNGGQVPLPHLSPHISPDLGRLSPGGNISPLLVGGHLPAQVPHVRTPLAPLAAAAAQLPFHQQQAILQQRMQDLSLAGHDFSSHASPYLPQDLRVTPHLAQMRDELLSLQETQAQLHLKRGLGVGGSARADNGYTTMERMMLQVHAQRQQEQQILEAQAQVQAQRGQSKRRLLDVLQPCSIEDDFHATAMAGKGGARFGSQTTSQQLGTGTGQRQRNQTHASNARVADVPGGLDQALHLRSTTMPSQYLSSRAFDGNGGSISTGVDRSHAIGPTANNNMFSVASKNATNAFTRKSSMHNIQCLSQTLPRGVSSTTTQGHGSAQDHGHGHGADVDDGEQLASPGLTFSPRTPATLSPATPFGGFSGFHAAESYEGSGMVGVMEKGHHGFAMGHHQEMGAHAKEEAKKMGGVHGGVGVKGVHV